jgi:hypothetical protein
MPGPDVPLIDDWLAALETRHRANLTSAEFLKAVRALSARYVERRAVLAKRSAVDSLGKRAAFASYYAPLHFLTTREIIRALGPPARSIRRVIDFGCGTGVASAAWALECEPVPDIRGCDVGGWAVAEAAWTWRALGLRGRARYGDMFDETSQVCRQTRQGALGFLFAWSVNELDTSARDRLLRVLVNDRPLGSSLLVIEPLARSAAPWWNEWARALAGPGLRQDEWHFDVPLPPALARIDEAAGFRREHLGARSLWRPAVMTRS